MQINILELKRNQVSGKICDGVSFCDAEGAVDEALRKIGMELVSDYELEKVANKFESTFVFSQYKVADRAHNLCYFEWLGDVELVNNEPMYYRTVTPEQLHRVAEGCFRPSRERVLEYCKA